MARGRCGGSYFGENPQDELIGPLKCLQLAARYLGAVLELSHSDKSSSNLIVFNPTLVNCIVIFNTLEHQQDCKELARIKRCVPKEGLGRWADHIFG